MNENSVTAAVDSRSSNYIVIKNRGAHPLYMLIGRRVFSRFYCWYALRYVELCVVVDFCFYCIGLSAWAQATAVLEPSFTACFIRCIWKILRLC